MTNIIKTVNLSKSFFLKKNLNILKKINIEIKKGELVALLGPSGSGKSTFLHMIALLDQPSNGEIFFEGKKTSLMNDVEKDEMRGKKISIVYQQNNLLNDFTSLENVAIAMISSGKNKDFAINTAKKILKKVGLSKRLDHFPNDLSVGEQQRVAIARAAINKPQLILADEPTGSLDQSTAKEIFNLFLKFKSQNRSIIYATHNRELVDKADYKLKIIDGNIRRSNE
ncbi:MAG: lipoprotein-releasing system ATP-binding protein LolD [Candidatus Pelagibacter sp.]|jgi:ABC-type lipoprotein export system ATPase subunit|nr:lipoprotein-releasing system ATP-binding protein LolD [Candidatus Pelagibacter sp.]MDP6440199.1 ABC transporter ATP-binding protein [Pelagibacteraceae bacterium]|tara:strand:- start:37149 stop:37826 length:678 start_codon:yes stop_codon:yes gene_type:complete